MTKAESTLVENRERIEVMEEHLKNVRQEVGHTNALIAAKKKEMATEEHLCALAARESGRCVLATPSLDDEWFLAITRLTGTAMSARDHEGNLEGSPSRNNTSPSFLLSESCCLSYGSSIRNIRSCPRRMFRTPCFVIAGNGS